MSSGGRTPLVEAMRYTQIGMLLVVPMVVGGALGYWLDKQFVTGPWLLLAGLVLGMAAGFVSFFRVVLARPPEGPPA